MSVNNILKKFVNLLLAYWKTIESLSKKDTTESFQIDWLQANWELIVEHFVFPTDYFANRFLVPYGDGADCNGMSSRVWEPDAVMSHGLVCKSINNNLIQDFLNKQKLDTSVEPVVFDRFVSMKDGWYYEQPPFDKILGEYKDEEVVIAFSDVDVNLQNINNYPCPCCENITFEKNTMGNHLTCPVCLWIDDPIQSNDPDNSNGTNKISVYKAKKNYVKYGAKDKESQSRATEPLPDEIPKNTKPFYKF